MLKFLSCVLSTTLIVTSVTPSLAQLSPRQILRGTKQALGATPKVSTRLPLLPGTRTGMLNDAALMRRIQLPLSLQHISLLPQNSQLSVSRQILSHPDAAQRALLLRSDFTVLALNHQASAQDMLQAVEFYRAQLANAEQLFAEQATAVSGMVADIASLGLFGVPSQDAGLILKAFEKSVGTVAEPAITAVSARALLRLGAYEPLEKMSALSAKQPELWEGIASYAQQNGLPLQIAPIKRQAADVTAMQDNLQEFGLLNTISINPSATSTYLYMSAGRGAAPAVTSVTAKPTTIAAAQTFEPQVAVAAQPAADVRPLEEMTEQNLHAFRDQGLASADMQATVPVYWEDLDTGKTLDVTFHFENQAAKEAFYNRVDLAPGEYFVFDRGTGNIIIRKELTAEQKANEAKAKERGFSQIFFEDGQKAPLAYYKVVFAREMAPAFAAASEPEVISLLAQYRNDLKQILSADVMAKYPALQGYLSAKGSVLDQASQTLQQSGQLMQISQDIAADLNTLYAAQAGQQAPIEVFKDDIGHWAQNFAGLAEGTFGTMGQANTSALGLLGIAKGALSNLPTAAGQFGPAWGPFIGAWAEKYGTKTMLNIGQLVGTTGHLLAAGSLTAGALGALPSLAAFAGMVGGITINGVAGSILKQINPMVAKQRASDRVSSSATVTDLNSWASAGGVYCYLFVPAVGGLTYLLTGSSEVGLGALAGMFGLAAAAPITANVLLRKSRIQNVVKADPAKKNIFSTIGSNLKFGFKSPFLRNMFLATAGGHFMGLGFNSGPGDFIKEHFGKGTAGAMLVSFAAIYATVYLGRKLGSIAIKDGLMSDKALAGLSALVGVSMGALSLLPGLDFVTRCGLFAMAGFGFANWVNVLQSIELNRPENAGKEAAVSSMYILARTSGMLTFVMGMMGDWLKDAYALDPSTAKLYALTMPLVAGAASLAINYKYITKDLWPTAKRWGISIKQWLKNKFTSTQGEGTQPTEDTPLQDAAAQ